MKPPAFQFYADDFLGGTLNFTDAEVGLYIRLLCVQWSSGGLVDDDFELESYGKGATSVKRVKSKFKKCEDGLLRNPRLEAERIKQEAYRASRSNNGKHGGRPNKPHENHMLSQTKAQESSPSPSPIVEREREASLPEIPPMSRKDYDSLCQMRGVPSECAEWFWNTHDARNWTDATGQIIRKVEPVLLNAFKNWRAKASQTQPGSKPSQSVYSITKVIEAKKEQADGLKARWAVETGLDTTWSSDKAKADYRELKKEIKELSQKLASMA